MAAVLATLTGLTTTGSNASRNYTNPFDDSISDGLHVVMGSDNPVDNANNNFAYLDSELEIIVLTHTKNATPETQINLIKKEVILALMADRTQGLSFVWDTVELGWSQPEISGEGEKPTAMCEGRFSIKYRRSYTDASA